jgi:DnaJ-class molecular chaperone
MIAVGIVLIGLAIQGILVEKRKTDAWAESMRRASLRCPCCMGMGWIMDAAHKAPTCTVCNGTGELPDKPAPEERGE